MPLPYYLQERDLLPIVLVDQWASETKRLTSTISLISALEYVGGQFQTHDFYLQERHAVLIELDAQWASGPKRCTSTLSLTSALE